MTVEAPVPHHTVGVRALCEFTAKAGDLDHRFTPSPSAQQGVAGHGVVARRRPAGYLAEVALSGQHDGLRVRGRADGFDPAARRVDEVKTHRGPLEKMPSNHRALHWAQAKVYGWLLCDRFGLDAIDVALVYFEISSQTETIVSEHHTAQNLRRFFEAQCERFLSWSRQEAAHADMRGDSLRALRFPHAGFRVGQRSLSEAVYRAATTHRCLLAQAPTGIGKTIATLFALLKAWPAQSFDKLYFLTAKGSGRTVALDALAQLRRRQPAPVIRIVELVARNTACEHPDKACHGDACPLARGFYDRLPAARRQAIDAPVLGREALRTIALEHGICPYYLGQEMVRWADVVVGDFNHYFDVHAILPALTAAHEWRVAVLVDEAHNLLERGRAMYSARLLRSTVQALRRSAPAAVSRPLDRLGRRWRDLLRDQVEAYRDHPIVPEDFAATLKDVCATISDHLAEQPEQAHADLLAFYFDALHFLRLVDLFGDHSIVDTTLEPAAVGQRRPTPDLALNLRNLVPAPHLRARFAAADACVLFSATLTPFPFHADMLGLPKTSATVDIDSPFAPDQLQVRIADRVSTRYRDRASSLSAIVDLMARQHAAVPGNYLAFFSSFDYLEEARERLSQRHPGIARWAQARGMSVPERDSYLAQFTEESSGIAFAVLGGSFAEGIDLPGRRLVGAFVATLGLPPPNAVNETLRSRLEATFGAGYAYTYLYPGIQKVIQAAGRVIRTEHDRGVVYLLDERFARAEVRRLLPRWWQVERVPLPRSSPARRGVDQRSAHQDAPAIGIL
jgi:DNA excision repair protein ERCC-2